MTSPGAHAGEGDGCGSGASEAMGALNGAAVVGPLRVLQGLCGLLGELQAARGAPLLAQLLELQLLTLQQEPLPGLPMGGVALLSLPRPQRRCSAGSGVCCDGDVAVDPPVCFLPLSLRPVKLLRRMLRTCSISLGASRGWRSLSTRECAERGQLSQRGKEVEEKY